jgi:hypothetical protein
MSFFDLRPLISPLVSSNCSIYNLVWPWHCLSFTKLYIEQFDDTNGVIRGRKSKKDRQCHDHTKLYIEQFDDTNGVIIGRSIYNLVWPGHCLSVFDLRNLITPLVSSYCSIYNLVWPWHCLSFFDLGPLITHIEQFDDNNGVIRGHKSKTDRQCHDHTKLYIEQFDDTNGVIRGRKSKKDRQCHGHTKL